MTVKEFILKFPSANRPILSTINQYILDNRWTAEGSGIVAADLTQLSADIFIDNASRELNPAILDFMEYSNIDIDSLTAAQCQTIIKYLYLRYKDKWSKLWDYIYLQEYNPIWNVDGTETTTRTFVHGKQTQETKNLTTTMNKGSTNTETTTNDITINDVYGFNSNTPVGNTKDTRNATVTNTGSGNDSDVMTGTDTFKDSGTDTETTVNTRGGNIGVTMTTQLLGSELDFREKFLYFDIIIKDIISELAINIY